METVSVDTILETGGSKSNDCKKNLENSGKQKKRLGRKRKPRKQENELKNNDSCITCQNGNADETVQSKERKEGETEKTTSEDQVQSSENCSSSTLPSELCQRDSISCEEPGATLHRKDPIFPTSEDSVPDANGNGASIKKSRRREKRKKKEAASCEEKIVDDAEKTTNEGQLHPPKNSLSNSKIQEGSHKHTQDSCEESGSAQLCTGPELPTREDSRPDATNMTCSQKKKRKKERNRNTLKESGVDMHSTNTEVAAKCNIISKVKGSALMNIEEKTGASVVINSCMKSKCGTGEQPEGTDIKLNDTVSQTQSPKAKKKKKRRTKTKDVCDPLGNNLATSVQSGPVECMENTDGTAGRELISNLASERVNCASGEENGFPNLGKTKEKKIDENTEVKEDISGAVVCGVRSKKRKGKKKKMSSADHRTADMEGCVTSGNTLLATVESGSVECFLDHSNSKDVENCHGNAELESVEEDTTSRIISSAMKEKSGVPNPGKLKGKTEHENVESDQDATGGEGVSDVGCKRHKSKRKKKENKNCESVANMDCQAVQCFLSSKIQDFATEGKNVQNVENTKKRKKDKKGEVEQGSLGIEGVSKIEVKTTEDSATEEKSVQNVRNTKKEKSDKKVVEDALEAGVSKVEEKSVQNDENTKNMEKDKRGEVDQDALVADSEFEGKSVQNDENTKNMKKDEKGDVSLDALRASIKVKTKKSKKSYVDHQNDNMKEKDDVSLPRNAEELEFNREKLETSLSSSLLIHNNVDEGVAPPETGDIPRCSCEGQGTKKLVVFDLNGILADIVQGFTGQFVPDGKVSYRSVFLRPFLHSFLDFCFERFDIGIWSSRRIGLDYMTNLVMKNHARNLLFCFGQNICIGTKFKTLEMSTKPLFLKNLSSVWERFGTCLTCGKRKYDETNTLLVDDSPAKSVCNPPNTGIFPLPYKYTDREDSALGPEGELRKYLERLADAKSVQKFVAENPFGQNAITETHESWDYYSKVVDEYSIPSTRGLPM